MTDADGDFTAVGMNLMVQALSSCSQELESSTTNA